VTLFHASLTNFKVFHERRLINQNDKDSDSVFERVVRYDKGITSDYVMASASYPINFDFAKIEVESLDSQSIGDRNREIGPEKTNDGNDNSSNYRKEIRYFWDGGLMTNTPLIQVVLMHRNYWYRVRGLKDSVPRLGICVINLHPKRQAEIPTDRDGVVNRNSDITFSDRTIREENTLLLTSDFVELVKALIKVAEEHGVKEDTINNLLDQKTKFHGELAKHKSYRDILEGRFQIDELIRVDRKNDEYTISNKTFDFSSETVKLLNVDIMKPMTNLMNMLETRL
jgi:hypothetical protein